jgi:hypothetical protein
MRLVCLILALLGLTVAAPAETRVALVVGNSHYGSVAPVGSARGSAETVGRALEDIGYQVTYAFDLTRIEFSNALNRFAYEIDEKAATVAVFYFVGYATQRDGDNMLLPSNAFQGEPKGIRLEESLLLLSMNSAARIVLIDPIQPPGDGVPQGLAPIAPRDNTLIATSTSPGHASPDRAGSLTPMAEAAARLLVMPGVTAASFATELRDAVMRATVGQSVPWTSDMLAAPLFLNRPHVASAGTRTSAGATRPVAGAPPDPADDAMWDMVKERDAPFLQHYLQFYPNGRHADEARQRLGQPAPDPNEAEHRAWYATRLGDKYYNYSLYLSSYPDGIYAGLALQRMGEITAGIASGDIPLIDQWTLKPGGDGVLTGGDGIVVHPKPAIETADIDDENFSPADPFEDPRELAVWGAVFNRDDAAGYREFLAAFPDGKFSSYARFRIGQLEAPAPDQDRAFEGNEPAPEEEIAPGAGGPLPETAGPAFDEPKVVAEVPILEPTAPARDGAADGSAPVTGVAPQPIAPLPSTDILDTSSGGGGSRSITIEERERESAAGGTTVTRYPSIDAPYNVVAGEIVTVTVALTEELMTPDVTAKAGPNDTSRVTEDGALEIQLPDAEDWPIDVDLIAPGFDLADGGKWSRRIVLYKNGDSDFARFDVKARPVSSDSKQGQFMVRLYHQGGFLGSASRPVTMFASADAMASNAPAAAPAGIAAVPQGDLASDVMVGDAVEVADLDVTIHYDDPARLGKGRIYIHSRHLGSPVSEEFSTSADMTFWLESEYARLVQLGLQLRGAAPLGATSVPADAESQRRFITKVAEGFGAELYRNYVPDEMRKAIRVLRQQGKLHSIQITSNSPLLPWELVRPENDDGSFGGFLGIDYRVARWAPRDSIGAVDRPLNRLPFSGVATIAPEYDGGSELPFQRVEVDALSKLAGFRLIGGDFSSVEKLVAEVSTGFIHFSGHGVVNDPGTGAPVFAIRLTDQALDPSTWRALSFAPHDKGNPFYFFNACDSGRAASLGGFVQGWGPAVLSSGASGFIGGMWPLADRTAAAFSTGFYNGISERLATGPVYVAEMLQDMRRQFYETGDPTYLAYTFYGNANLQVVRQ